MNRIFANEQDYLNYQKSFFEEIHDGMTIENHQHHNSDPEYWDILLGDIKRNPNNWKGKIALDFGCGCGRNIKNLLDLADWARVDGCDISKKNADYSMKWNSKYHPSDKINTWETDGKSIQPCDENGYDFIMSHIVFQHISSYDIRYSILTDMFKSLKQGGMVSLHYMDMSQSNNYYENTKIFQNCIVGDKNYLITDLNDIGYSDVSCETGIDYFTRCTTYYVKGYKK